MTLHLSRDRCRLVFFSTDWYKASCPVHLGWHSKSQVTPPCFLPIQLMWHMEGLKRNHRPLQYVAQKMQHGFKRPVFLQVGVGLHWNIKSYHDTVTALGSNVAVDAAFNLPGVFWITPGWTFLHPAVFFYYLHSWWLLSFYIFLRPSLQLFRSQPDHILSKTLI